MWTTFTIASLLVATIGGAVMLVVVIAAHGAAGAPLAIIGALWLVFGILGYRRFRRTATSLVVDGSRLELQCPGSRQDVPLGDLIEIRWTRLDYQHLQPLVAVTPTAKYLIAPRMKGMFEVLVAVHEANPLAKMPT